MAIQIKGKQFTAPRARFEYNGIVIGWANSINFGHAHNVEEMMCIGALEKVEDVYLGYRPSFSANQFYLVDQSVVTLGMMVDPGQTSDQHLFALLELGDASAVLVDKVDGNIVGLIEGLKMTGANHSITPNAMVMSDLQFVCRRLHYFGSAAAA